MSTAVLDRLTAKRAPLDAGKFREDEYKRWCEIMQKKQKPCR